MKKIWIVTLLTMQSLISIAQLNLIENSSFEDTVLCPFYYNQTDRAVGWSAYRLSPDYFNSCNNTFVGVPLNDEGFQYARTGNAYMGFISHAHFTVDYRECFGRELIQQMIPGHNYFVKFYVSLAVGTIQHTNIATNKLGAKFSTVPYISLTQPIPINNYAHVYTDSIISDTTNWVEISGFFTADSAYQFISIGNFFNDSATTHIAFDSLAAFAYYYVDDVFVTDSIVTSVNENQFSNPIEIFPSLFNDELIIKGNDIKSVSIFDMSGRGRIESAITNSSIIKINVSSLSRGLYFIRINTSKKSFIRKIIKQ